MLTFDGDISLGSVDGTYSTKSLGGDTDGKAWRKEEPRFTLEQLHVKREAFILEALRTATS